MLVTAAALMGACRGGCARRPAEVPAADRVLALLPAETRIVASVDLARVRASAFWRRISELAQDDPQDRRAIAELTARTGLDPLRQVRRIVAAFPEDARKNGEFALVVEGEGFDEKRLIAYARDEAALRGGKIEPRVHGRRTLWAGAGPERIAGFFQGGTRFLLGGGGWGDLVADLADGGTPPARSAAADPELGRLCARIDTKRALWFAAVVPQDVRKALLADPKFDAAASVTRLALAVDLGAGLAADLVADLSNSTDARVLADRVQSAVHEAKRNPKALMLGLGPYLDAVSARAQGPTLQVRLVLPEAQVNDLLGRLAAMARLGRERQVR